MVPNNKKNIKTLLNKMIKQNQGLLFSDPTNERDYEQQIKDYRFVICLLEDKEYFNQFRNYYEDEEDDC